MIYVITGVLGSGKSTIGKMISDKLKIPFYDADEYITHEDRKKLSKGITMTEKEMKDLMFALRAIVDRELARGGSAVIACTALKEQYRKLLMHDHGNMKLIFLKGDKSVIEKRLKHNKTHHNASWEIVESQFKILEEPKNAQVFDITITAEKIVDEIIKQGK